MRHYKPESTNCDYFPHFVHIENLLCRSSVAAVCGLFTFIIQRPLMHKHVSIDQNPKGSSGLPPELASHHSRDL